MDLHLHQCSVAQNNGIGAWKCLEENPGSGGARCGKSGALRGLRSKKKTISRIKTVEVYFATREYLESRDLTFGAQLALWHAPDHSGASLNAFGGIRSCTNSLSTAGASFILFTKATLSTISLRPLKKNTRGPVLENMGTLIQPAVRAPRAQPAEAEMETSLRARPIPGTRGIRWIMTGNWRGPAGNRIM
ncbi:hypothetical protein C8J57DRAFT_1246679 [Mycena rebaudengoi]|nr:hypothetical protein C8J57DRAFT_1246679 [Mycena rebaudengoi]